MSDVFISYATEDWPRVKPLVDALQKERGWSVWWDRTILPGKNWERVLEAALRDARCVIVLWSPISVESDWVRNEALEGKERDILVPALLESVPIPLAFKRIQAANLIGWSGKLPSDQFDELARAVTEVLSSPTTAPSDTRSDKEREQPPKQARRDQDRKRVTGAVPKKAVRDVEGGHELYTLASHPAPVYGVAVSANGRLAASASADNTLKTWDMESRRELRILRGHSRPVYFVAVSGDGRCGVSASWDTTLKIWDVESGRQIRTLEGHTDWVNGVALSENGRVAVSASYDQTLKVWDIESGSELHTLRGHSAAVLGVALSADGRRAVSASLDRTLKVWNVESGDELHTLEGHSDAVPGVAVTGDGRIAISASWDTTLKVWDVESGHEQSTLQGHSAAVNGVAVSKDGRRAVSASDDKTLKVWDVESGREIRTLAAGALLFCCAVSSDEKTIIAGDSCGVIHYVRLK